MLVYVLWFVVGFNVGLIFWAWIVARKIVGHLVVDNSLKEERPYLFVEIKPGKTYFLTNPNNRYVVFDVEHKNFIEEEKKNG